MNQLGAGISMIINQFHVCGLFEMHFEVVYPILLINIIFLGC